MPPHRLAVMMVLFTTLALAQNQQPSSEIQTGTYTVPHDVAARQVAGLVVDSEGLPVLGALIQEFSWDWKNILAETRTDREGHFLLIPGAPVRTHYLRVSALGFDILEVRVDERQKTGTLRLRLRGSS